MITLVSAKASRLSGLRIISLPCMTSSSIYLESSMVSYRYDDIPVTEGRVLVGVPDCPICFRLLQYNPMPVVGEKHWRCPDCGWWDTQELIEMLMKDE